jgi:hypothetical protein
MNGSLEKATRRDLRRAVGVGALEVIESMRQDAIVQRAALEAVAATQRRLETRIDDANTHVLRLANQQREYVDRGDKSTDAKVDAFLQRGFFARLRWLVRGL